MRSPRPGVGSAAPLPARCWRCSSSPTRPRRTARAAQYAAVRAASQAGREHPSRVLAVITRKPKAESRLDAEIRVGETGPGETILLRMYGALRPHADSA